jgi:hypothetical protein
MHGVARHERAGKIAVDHLPPFAKLQLVRRLPDIDPGIVHEHVQAAEPLHRLGHERHDRGLIRDVDLDRHRLRAEAFQLRHRAPALVAIPARHHDGGACRGHAARHAEADAAIATRHHRHAPGEIERPLEIGHLQCAPPYRGPPGPAVRIGSNQTIREV